MQEDQVSGYVAYEIGFSPKMHGSPARAYWQGEDSRCWAAGGDARTRAQRFPDQSAARAAVAAEHSEMLQGVGYEWVPVVEEQLELFALVDGARA